MAKVDPREKVGRTGPVRTSSGTRAVVRVASLPPDVSSLPGANDVQPSPEVNDRPCRDEMPTRELDLEQIRAMALRCASDVGGDAPGLTPAPSPLRPRLELVLGEEADSARTALAASDDVADVDAVDAIDIEGLLPERSSSLAAAAVVVVALVVATLAALGVYGALP